MRMRLQPRSIVLPLALLTLAALGAGCGKSIDSGHRGVYYNWRNGTDVKNVLGEGFHWLAPWNKIFEYDVRAKDRVEKLTVLSKDQLQIECDASIRYRLVPNKVAEVHANIGDDYFRMIIQPALRNATRDVITGYESIDAYRSRSKIEQQVHEKISSALSKYDYFSVERVMLRRMDFPKSVVDAIERKLAMKQEADREKYALDKARIVAERNIVEAEAMAKAQRILKAELNDTLLRWRGIEATLSLAQSGNSKVVIIGGGKDGLPLILGGTAP